MVFDAEVTFLDLLVKGESVLEARASAAGDEYPQFEVRIRLLADQFAHLARRSVGENQHIGRGWGRFALVQGF